MKRQIFLVKFAWKYDGQWFNYPTDLDSVELMCATSNLGIIELKGGMFTLKSREKARQFLAAKEC